MYELDNLSNWSGRNTKINDEYLFQKIEFLNLEADALKVNKYGYALLGFSSDEGIRRNQGRIGAAEGPKSFRNCLAKMPLPNNNFSYYDAGNVTCINGDLESAQKELGEKVMQILALGLKPIIIGGGHETAWGHFLGLRDFFTKDINVAVLNCDAHFDLRPLMNDLATSGTPFYQISRYLQKRDLPFNYYCVGIQKCANTKSLFNYADYHNVRYRLAEQINNDPRDLEFIEQIVEQHDYIYVSICLDVFNVSISPGVSAPQILGIYPDYVIQLLNLLKKSKKVISLDIVELSPPHDINQQTAQLAACLVFEYLL